MALVSHNNSLGMDILCILFGLLMAWAVYWQRSSPDRNSWFDKSDTHSTLVLFGYMGLPMGGVVFLGSLLMLMEKVFHLKVTRLIGGSTLIEVLAFLPTALMFAILLGYRGQWLLPRWARPLAKDRLARIRAERRYRLAKLWARLTGRPAPPPPAIRDIRPPRAASTTPRASRKVQQQVRPAAPHRIGPRSATIRITRPRRFGNAMLRKCIIQVDGDDAAALRLGGAADIAVTPGYHSVRVVLDWTRSPCCEIDVPLVAPPP